MRRINHKKTDLVWDGRSIRWSQPHGRGVLSLDPELWMCAQDLSTEIWAQFDRLERIFGRHKVEPIRIENCSASLLEFLTNCLPFNGYRRNLSDAVCNFIRFVAQEFVLKRKIVFEVRKGWDRSTDPPRLEEVALVAIPYDSVMWVGRWAFQVVPPGVESDGSSGRIIRLDHSRLLLFTPPRQLQGALARMNKGTPIIGQLKHDWMMRVGRHKVPEDFKAVMLAYHTQLARLTASIGWNTRGSLSDYITEQYWAIRELRWKRFCIVVRDSILTTLGKVFALLGSWKGEQPRLVWESLPTIKQVEEGEARLKEVGARFDEILKPFM